MDNIEKSTRKNNKIWILVGILSVTVIGVATVLFTPNFSSSNSSNFFPIEVDHHWPPEKEVLEKHCTELTYDQVEQFTDFNHVECKRDTCIITDGDIEFEIPMYLEDLFNEIQVDDPIELLIVNDFDEKFERENDEIFSHDSDNQEANTIVRKSPQYSEDGDLIYYSINIFHHHSQIIKELESSGRDNDKALMTYNIGMIYEFENNELLGMPRFFVGCTFVEQMYGEFQEIECSMFYDEIGELRGFSTRGLPHDEQGNIQSYELIFLFDEERWYKYEGIQG